MPERDSYFDNLKALLIALVVFVHFFSVLEKHGDAGAVIDLLLVLACSFHMPLFMFISGYFSKKTSYDGVIRLIIVYILAQIILTLVHGGNVNGKLYSILFRPQFSMWYLFSLIVLRMLIPLIARIRVPVIILFVFSVGIMGVIANGSEESAVTRMVANAVFFYLGYNMPQTRLDTVRKYPKWLYAVGFFGGTVLLYVLTIGANVINTGTLRSAMLRANSVSDLHVGILGYFIYAGITVFAVFMSLMVMGMMPSGKGRSVFTMIGRNTMTIYIAQAVIFLVLRKNYGTIQTLPIDPNITMLIIVILTLIVFGNDFVRKGFNSFTGWLQKLVCHGD